MVASVKSKTGCRIVIASHAWAGDMVGGAFKVATDWACFLADRGHQVHYLCGERSASRQRTVHGVTIHSYSYPETSGLSALKRHVMESAACASRIAANEKVDILVGHSPLQYRGALRGIGETSRRIYSVHSPFVDEIGGDASALKSFFRKRIAKSIDGNCIKRSTGVITFSAFTLDRLRKYYGVSNLVHGTVCPAWVDTQRFSSDGDRRATRKQLGGPWQSEDKIFMTLRRLESRMGIDQLIHAAKIVSDAGYQFRLMIGGDGSQRTKLQALIHELNMVDRVRLLGRIDDDQLASVYSASDCFVLPTSRLECFGLIILESYSCGIPVIATPVAAIPEIVQQHSADWLTSDASAKAIAERMMEFLNGNLLSSPAELREIASKYKFETRASELERVALQDSPLHGTALAYNGA